MGGSVTFMLLAGIYDAGAALVGGSTWTQRVRHREQARKGPLRRQIDQPTRGRNQRHSKLNTTITTQLHLVCPLQA